MTFRPAVSSQVVITTTLALVVLSGLGVLFLVLQHQTRDRAPIHYTFLFVGCLMLFLVIGSLNFRIRSYEINSGNLVIHAGFSKKTFSLSGLQDVKIEDRPFAGASKDAANAGIWSFYGLFSSERLGGFRAYATSTARGVLLTWPDKKVLITPDDPERFIQAVAAAK